MVDPDKSGMLQITIEHTPSLNDPEGADELYRALGILIVAWGRLEGHFVLCLLTLMNLTGNEALGYKLPMNWDDRASMWRRAFNIPDLQQFKEGSLQYLAKMTDVANDRNAIVHALWEQFTPGTPPTISIVKIRRKKNTADGLDFGRSQITVSELQAISKRINRLNLSLAPLSQFLMKLRAVQKPPPADIRKL
jgi:hypothetical protein